MIATAAHVPSPQAGRGSPYRLPRVATAPRVTIRRLPGTDRIRHGSCRAASSPLPARVGNGHVASSHSLNIAGTA